MNTLPIQDMSNTFVEHSFVINNFVVMVGRQMKDSLCRILGDGVQYQWHENNDNIVIPDVSINCNIRNRKSVSLTGIPMIETEPTMSVSNIVNLMKSYTTYHIWERYPYYLQNHFWKEHTFWTDGYFACSVGNVSEEMLRKYIENQG